MTLGLGAAGNTEEASLSRSPLTFCCVVWFVIGHGLVQVCGLGVGDSCSKRFVGLFVMSSSLIHLS